MKIVARLLSVPLALVAFLSLWLAVAPFTPHIPYWGAGALIGPQYVGPVIIFSLILLLLAVLGRFASRSFYVPGAFAAVALIAGIALFGTQIHAAKEQGTDVDIRAALSWAGVESTDEGPDHTVAYDFFHGEDLDMDIYTPNDGGTHPVMMYVHGGGWDQMNKHSQAFNMRQMAQRGYLVLSIDYTLSSWDQPTWKVVAGQVGCAMNWVNAHAADYDGDPGRFFTYGESAGGQLVLNATPMPPRTPTTYLPPIVPARRPFPAPCMRTHRPSMSATSMILTILMPRRVPAIPCRNTWMERPRNIPTVQISSPQLRTSPRTCHPSRLSAVTTTALFHRKAMMISAA